MFQRKYRSIEKWGSLFFLFVVSVMITPINAAVRASWRVSTESAPWQAETDLTISNYSGGGSEILLDTTAAGRLQTIDGFGGSPNEVGMLALHKLSAKMQDSLIKSIYDTVWGCKMAVIRLPIACSDFSNGTYSYDDLPSGVTDDYNMTRVSLARDLPGTIAFTKAAQVVNPNVKVWGSPWTAPPWMKNNNNWITGNGNECAVKQNSQVYTAYALYFSKVVTLLKAEVNNYFALSFQNEPRVCQPFPSTMWPSGAVMDTFMRNYLAPRMRVDHPDVELWTPTMNVGDQTYFQPLLADTSSHVAAACFQYEGRPVLPWVHSTYPKVKCYFTEMTCGDGNNYWSYNFTTSFFDLKYYISNGVNGADWWNMILETKGNSGPTVNFRQDCMITVDTVAKTFKYMPTYYLMKHFSYYIRPNAKIVATSGSYANNQVSAKNVDGSIAVVAYNNGGGAQTVKIKFGNQMVTANLPNSSLGSLRVWDDAVSVSQPGLAGKSLSRIASVNRFYKVAGDKFSFPGEFEGKTCMGAFYDINGRLVREFSIKAGTVSLLSDLGVSKGVYVVHVKAVRN